MKAPRLLAPIRTSTPLRPPASQSQQIKTIFSYHCLLSAAKLQPASDILYAYEEDNHSYTNIYEESYERWQEEAAKMREIRVVPEDFEELCKIEQYSKEQVQDLLEAMASDDVLDIRRGWVVCANY
ncbi:hypothetical protein SK128_000893 [Halocaridina rubra]|uniref:Uncharacterized protein n=1 Tax=Halocaridina rubra TaxID=373956 RepID=A0AAN8ZTR7_HALRR